VFKRDGEPEPSGEGVDALVGYQPSARRVGTPLELEGDTHRPRLIHTGSIAGAVAGRVTASPLFFADRPASRLIGASLAQRGRQLAAGADG